MKKKRILVIISTVFTFALTLLNLTIYYGLNWIQKNVGIVSIDEIIFHLRVPLKGTGQNIIDDILLTCVLPITIIFIVLLVIFFLKPINSIVIKFKLFKKHIRISVKRIIRCVLLIANIILLIVQWNNFNNKFKLTEYMQNTKKDSDFIEEKYVDPKDVSIKFPNKKRNLIYIYLESMESTYTDLENGGIQEISLISELTDLAKENINFSNTEQLGGAYQVFGASWTIAGMVSQTSGIPLKIPIEQNSYTGYGSFLPGVYNLGDILLENGYKNVLMIGSDGKFAGRDTFFETHGNYEIKDYYKAVEEGIIDKDYYVFWGMEDSYLFEWAKLELEKLSNEEEPFNLTLLTVNTHFPDGYLEKSCEKVINNNQYANVIYCSSKQVSDFINWIKEQDFYKDTTIIISGDHLTMADNSILYKDKYDRTIFNTFINSAVKTNNNLNRKFSNFDMFPTTLAALGVQIENNKLGLGVNLFSNEQTLLEIDELSVVNDELSRKSKFYDNKFLYGSKE